MSVQSYGGRTAISLPRDAVSHWSTAMYGRGPTGHIAPYIETSSDKADRPIQLNLETPGGKAPDGIHGGARRIDVNLTQDEAEALGKALIALAKEASR